MGLDRVDRAVGRSGEDGAIGREEGHFELFERQLRQVGEFGREATGLGSGSSLPISLAWMPKPSANMKRRYWLPGTGSAK